MFIEPNLLLEIKPFARFAQACMGRSVLTLSISTASKVAQARYSTVVGALLGQQDAS